MNIVYLNNGKVIDRNLISVYNPSFLYGINVFEGIRAYWSDFRMDLLIFDLNEHLERLFDSAKTVGFDLQIEKEDLSKELLSIIAKEGIKENCYIRITFFVDGETNWSECNLISRLISIRSMISDLGFAQHISLGITRHRRISFNSMPPSVKAGANYLNSRYAFLDAKERGFDGALFLSQDNFISESTGSCIFFIKNDVLFTPSIDSDILVGITRNRVMKLARFSGIKVFEENITVKDLPTFAGAFLVGTMIELKPIAKIEDIVYDPFHEIITKLITLLKNYVYGTEV